MQVLIVDSSSHIILRLEEMLADTPVVTVVHTSVSYENAIRLFIENKPDVVLLCAGLPDNKSLKLLSEIKAGFSKTNVVVLFTNTTIKQVKVPCMPWANQVAIFFYPGIF